MIDGIKTGFLLEPNSKDRILPITHINLVMGNDGSSVGEDFAKWNTIMQSLDPGGAVLNCMTYDQLLTFDVSKLKFGAICYVVTEEKYYSYTPAGWKPMETDGTGGGGNIDLSGYVHIWVGSQPPEDVNMIWLDTNSDGFLEDLDDLSLLYSLQNKVNELATTITILNKRLEYIEQNGIVIPGGNGGTSPLFNHILLTDDNSEIPLSEDFELVLEDGSILSLSDNFELIIEGKPENPGEDSDVEYTEDNVLLENGLDILLEDGSSLLLFEKQTIIEKPDNNTTTSDNVLLENGLDLLLENGSTLLFEKQTIVPAEPSNTEKGLLLDNGSDILLENNQRLLLEMQ